MSLDNRPEPHFAGVFYGTVVYWGTIAGALLALAGTWVAFLTGHNVIEPGYMFAALWHGASHETIWREATGWLPQGHWYLTELRRGDGLTAAGLALAMFSVIPAIMGSAWLLVRSGHRIHAAMAALSLLILLAALFGVI